MSPTWPEARAAKETRQRAEQVHYTPDRLGALCVVCKTRMVAAVADVAGEPQSHPSCDPRMAVLEAAARRATR